jgi:TolB protein
LRPLRPRQGLGPFGGLALAGLLGLITVAGCGGSAGQAGGPPPAPPPLTAHDLLFDGQNAEGRRLLYRARLDGSAPEVLGLGYEGTRPQARPDGQALVYASIPTAESPAQLMLVDDPTQPATRLSPPGSPAEREGAWSPDGTRLAFHSQAEDASGDVFVAQVQGRLLENRRNLTPRQPGDPLISPDVTPAWSPDGTRLAFTSYRSGSPALWVMNADGSQLRQLTETSPQHGDYFPTWSPDGQWLAFQRLSVEAAVIGRIPVAGGTPEFFAFAGRAYAPAWSPDGAWIAFSGLVDGEYDIHVRPVAGGPILRLRHPGADQGPSWIRRP